jgi:thioesterase domain-containing protein
MKPPLVKAKPEAAEKELRRSERPRDVIEMKLQRIWENSLGISPIGRTDDFFEIGGSSLKAVDVSLAIEATFNLTLHPAIIAENSTIEKLGAALAGDFLSSGGPLVKLQDGTGQPVFFVHSGQGDATTYGLLARQLPGRTVYAFQAIGVTGTAWPLTSVHAMADLYLPEILAADPDGPYLLGGACIGSMVSLELAHRLVALGKKVALLAQFDGRMPRRIARDEKLARRIYLTIRWPVHEGWRIVRWWLAYALGLSRRRRWLPSWRKFIRHMNANAYRNYRPASYPGEITLFITTETSYGKHDPRMELKEWATNKRVISIAGHRDGLFARPMVDALARELRAAIAQAEGG